MLNHSSSSWRIPPAVHLVFQKLKDLGTGQGGFFSAVQDFLVPFHSDAIEASNRREHRKKSVMNQAVTDNGTEDDFAGFFLGNRAR